MGRLDFFSGISPLGGGTVEYIVVGVVAAAAVTLLDDEEEEKGEGRGLVPCADDENVENNSGSANVFFLVFFVSW